VFRDGLPAAADIGGTQHLWLELEPQAAQALRNKLIRH
jgi:ATP-dependent Lhr-like helicase